jgi:hypothetical protein
MAIDVKAIEAELEKISAKLHGECPRLQMTALYAAQQALSWVLDDMELIETPYQFILPASRQTKEVIAGIPVR